MANFDQQFFGTEVTPMSFESWLERLANLIEADNHRIVAASHNLHSVYLTQKETVMQQFYARADHCYIDGMPVRWLLRLCGLRSSRDQRFSLMDRFPDLLSHCEQQEWSVFYLGGHREVASKAKEVISDQYPNLRFENHHGYIADSETVVRAINAFNPDILLVGMGMPTQERWLLSVSNTLDYRIAVQTGATLDYYVGAQAQPPRWLSDLGFAWLYRLVMNPGRLWQRYLLEPVLLLPAVVKLVWKCRTQS
ncbi:MAG: WecB/TagA/CpsF family glycosyltransferase [bacterium]